MMDKKIKIIFTAACFALCMALSVCMFFARPDGPIGNERTAEAPSFTTEDGSFNADILKDAGNWFEHHFAFRPELISADAKIQSGLFGVSNNAKIVTGTDGWLYYSASLKDYLGDGQLSERGMWNLAHNISILQNYVESKGAKFLIMFPPNKNSLYGGNMPYYYGIPVSDEHDRDGLKEALTGMEYLDLFNLIGSEEEVLYLKEDSHWNNAGAALVSDAVLDRLGKPHESFRNAPAQRAKTHDGDLRAILYPAWKDPEYDYTFETDGVFEYNRNNRTFGDEVSVEDVLVETENPDAAGRLLMYRDSFADTLIPFLSQAFSYGVYSKAVPGNMVSDMEKYRPDCVVLEKAERNLHDFVTVPYIVPAPEVQEDGLTEVRPVSNFFEPCMADHSYVSVHGTLREEDIDIDTRIYIAAETAGGRHIYEAFTISEESGDCGFLAYLPAEALEAADGSPSPGTEIFIYKK